MRVAITGSSGLIGTALRHALEADGHEVIRIVRSGAREPGMVRWDLASGDIDTAGVEGVDGVVHLAGAGIADKRWTEARKQEILDSRTTGTDLIARAVASLDRKPRVLVSAAGVNAYGDRGDEVLTEVSEPGDGFLADVVLAWEAAAQPAEDAGLHVPRIRSGLVLDRSGGALAKMLPLFRFGLGGRLGSGQQWWPWITLADEVRAIRFLLEADISGPVNLAAPNPVTNAVFTKTLGAVMSRPTVLPVPSFGPKLLLGGELAEELLFTSMRVVPAVLTEAGFKFLHADLETALRAVLAHEESAA
jgi:uncharacterized protein (TIGR01777 family)